MIKQEPCENCGNLVASTSKLCPYCGHNPHKLKGALGCLAAAVLIPIAAISFFSDHQNADTLAVANGESSAGSDKMKPAAENDSETNLGRQNAEEGMPPSEQFDEATLVDESAASEAESLAIGVALETGKSQKWNGGGISGQIKVKSVDGIGEGLCRKYRAERDKAKSAYSTVCKDQSGQWVTADQ